MLVEIWSNHELPIVHPNLTQVNEIGNYVLNLFESLKRQGLKPVKKVINEDRLEITQNNGVTVTFYNGIVRS